MINCSCCYCEFVPEPEVTFIGTKIIYSRQEFRELLETGQETPECRGDMELVCLCEKCYTKYKTSNKEKEDTYG